jgi:SNF2 family DNA or RNA helicase/uncharacterized Zn finger protein
MANWYDSYGKAPAAKAGSYRRNYGTSWWGKQFLAALNKMDYSSRLGRGKTYANKGLVEELEKHPDGTITATVQGSRPSPYRISISWAPFTDQQKKTIVKELTQDLSIFGRLLAGELPAKLHETLLERGIDLFPSNWKQLHVNCSCPDWATPCKHEAAVFYVLAAEIDADPFSIFSLRGLSLRNELPLVFNEDDAGPMDQIVELEQLLKPVSEELSYFDWSDDHLKKLDFSTIEPLTDRMIELLPASPPFDPAIDFRSFLHKIYLKTAKYAARLLAKESAVDTSLLSPLRQTAQVDLVFAADLSVSDLHLYGEEDQETLSFTSEEDILEFLKQLEAIDDQWLCDDLRSIRLAYQFARQLAINGAFIPQLLYVREKENYVVRYLPATNDPNVTQQMGAINALLAPGIPFYNGREGLLEWESTAAGSAVLSGLLSVIISQSLGTTVEDSPARRLFSLTGAEDFSLVGTERYPFAIQRWLNRLHLGQTRYQPVFKVVETPKHIEVAVEILDAEKPTKTPVALDKFLKKRKLLAPDYELLRNLSQLSEHFPRLSDHLAGEPLPMRFDLDEFTPVLRKMLPLMEAFGLTVILPRSLKKLLRPNLRLSASSNGGDLSSGIISLEGIINFNWQTAIGDELMGQKEFLKLLRESTGLVRFKEQFAYLDKNEISQLIDQLEQGPQLSVAERMQAMIAGEYEGQKVLLDQKLKDQLADWRDGPSPAVPEGLKAKLRPYQESGFGWLYANARFGFGSIIADDMGLGKTLQVIALILKLKEEGQLEGMPVLVVVPTSLLGNWAKEINKFAPGLTEFIYHGSERTLPSAADFDVLLTTYGIVRSETAKLNKISWKLVVIDESQAIKNPKAAQSKAIKRLKAPLKVAMSGTPVENRLLDYWSVMDFTIPGYLSNQTDFAKTYGNPIQKERDQAVAKKFLAVTAPFVLRRLKSDKSIISDLPEKIIQDEQCNLLPAQAALYESVVRENLRMVQESEEGIGRQGLILKLITALKQVCNHPKHFLKQAAPDFNESGKAALLKERLSSILESGEKTLIFTQYREMGDLLVQMIEASFGISVPFLHGGCSSKQRDEMVSRFQEDRRFPIFILSIKAGGTGLNLTAANHVIHYDLWWNPAVENQATDRAYRIGQTTTVFVHRMITENTFEEKIDRLIKSKRELAEMSVGTGESWIGKMSDAELDQLVRLEKKLMK